MEPIKIFISSVQSEFAEERKQIFDYIRQDALLGQFFVPFIFENLPAIEISAKQAYSQQAADCDIYLGLLGNQYGWEDKDGISPTEKEYDIATLHHAYRLVYIRQTDSARHPKEEQFIAKVEQNVVRRTFLSYEELKTSIYSSLIHYLEQKEIIRRLPFDAMPHPFANWDAIDESKVEQFVNEAKAKRQFAIPFSAGLTKIFSAINVISEDGRLTNSAILLFGKNPQRSFPTSEVKCVQFYGTEVEKPLKNYQVYRGTLFEMIDQAVAFVMSRIDAEVCPRDNGASAPIRYEIPERVVTEAIVNAVAHRDYTSNASVQIMLFRDRLEVWSPGRLPYGLTPHKLTQLHRSNPTNPIIAHPLFLAGYIDRIGTGTTDIIKYSVETGLREPQFIQEDDFRVIIWRKESNGVELKSNGVEQKSNGVETKSNGVDIKLTAKQRSVVEYCKDIPRTSSEILSFVGVTNQRKTFVQYITKLVEAGLLRPTRGKPNNPKQCYITTNI